MKSLMLVAVWPVIAAIPFAVCGSPERSGDRMSDASPEVQLEDRVYPPAGTYDPRLLMPLAVGHSWTYRWIRPGLADEDEISSKAPLSHCRQVYEYGDKKMFALNYLYRARIHEETYTILRRDGEHFFFEITTDPEVPMSQVRDGRFDGSLENCWTWWRNGDSQGLTESIKREWTYPSRQYLLPETRNPDEPPADHRNAIHVKWQGERWHCGFAFSMGGTQVIEAYNPSDKVVAVPAGTFTNCIEVTEEVYDEKKIKEAVGDVSDIPEAILIKNREQFLWWRTRTFWAPGVGRVLEYQQLADGTIAYRLELIRFSPSGGDVDKRVE